MKPVLVENAAEGSHHYAFAYSVIRELNARPIDPSGKEALEDELYRKGMFEYDLGVKKMMDPIWLNEFIASGKDKDKEQLEKLLSHIE